MIQFVSLFVANFCMASAIAIQKLCIQHRWYAGSIANGFFIATMQFYILGNVAEAFKTRDTSVFIPIVISGTAAAPVCMWIFDRFNLNRRIDNERD